MTFEMSKLFGFRSRIAKKPLPFTRISPQTGQVITSSGNPSLDIILGGGLPVGSICLVEEDKFATYSKVLVKYFLVEGIFSNHSVFLGSLDDSPTEMLEKLPERLDAQEVETDEVETQTDQNCLLRIAWCNNELPMVNADKGNAPIGHHFNLLGKVDDFHLNNADVVVWSDDTMENDIVLHQDGNESDYLFDNVIDCESADTEDHRCRKSDAAIEEKNITVSPETTPPQLVCKSTVTAQIFENPQYFRLLKEVQQLLGNKLQSGGFIYEESMRRVCITSLASALWHNDHYAEDLLKFLTILRATIRSSVSVCFVTIPMHLVAKYDDTLVSKIRNLVDYAIELESFAGSDKETNPAFKEYHGLCHLRKITAFNSLSAYMPETTDLAFKLRRTKFVIEKLHLPAKLQDDNVTVMDTQPTLSGGSNISTNPKISMDF